MGAYDGNPGNDRHNSEDTPSQSNPLMENGIESVVDKLSGLGVNGSSNDGLFQVIRAVEAAETTIKLQVEENNTLRVELQKRTQELERYKSDNSTAPRSHSDILVDEHILGPYKEHQSVSDIRNQDDKVKWTNDGSLLDLHHILVPHHSLMSKDENSTPQAQAESEDYSERPVNGTLNILSTCRGAGENVVSSHMSSVSSRSPSPHRYRREEECDLNIPRHGQMEMGEVNDQKALWKQDLFVKVRDHEEEILQLRKHLADFSMKEAQLRNEKYILEKRVAYMRMAFDQQQQEIVEAASKAISYRQDIIEENIRLTYALQAAQQERSTYISSLLPLLAEYSLQPSASDAQSIVTNLKVLFKHLQEKLLVTEAKLKESQYQLAPWSSDVLSRPITPQSQHRSIGMPMTTSHGDRHELVSYSHGDAQISYSNPHTPTAWDQRVDNTHHAAGVGLAERNMEPDIWGRSSPTSRNAQDVAGSSVAQGASHAKYFDAEPMAAQLSFKDLVSSSEMGSSEALDYQSGRESSAHWGARNSSYSNPTPDDPSSSFSPHLPPVLEETSSSFSEEDDPLPGIEGLQISGEAFPGRELQACGYSINGTTSCNFEWVRYLEDGSVNYIEGAKQPNYLVTADDVDSYLAIEVQPLDNRKRKGELVKVFANDQRKITCDPEMHEQIEKTLHNGHGSYEVSLAAGYLDIWEPAILAIKRVGYSIRCNGPRGVVVTEKFSPRTDVVIPYGDASTFTIIGAGGMEHLLRATENSSLRDIIVLTMRLFIMRAVEKRKGKKRGRLFFNK